MRQIRDRILLKLAADADAGRVLADCGLGEIDFRIPQLNVVRSVVPEGADPDALLARARAHPLVAYAHFDAETFPLVNYNASVDDPLIAGGDAYSTYPAWQFTWHHGAINTYRAWRETKGDPSVLVAFVDTGVMAHEDLIFDEANYYSSVRGSWGGPLYDKGHHGLMTCGIVFATHGNGKGVAGIAPNCTPAAVATFAQFSSPVSYKASGIVAAADRGVALGKRTIISNSWGVFDPNAAPAGSATGTASDLTLITDAVAYAVNTGALVVAASGNDNVNLNSYSFFPSELPNVLCVGAIFGDGERAVYSNYGASVHVVAPTNIGTLGAPGSAYASIGGDNTYWSGTGTSSACPVTSGVCALTWSVNPALTRQQVTDIVKGETSPLYNSDGCFAGLGLVNAARSVLRAKTTVPANAGQVFPYLEFSCRNWTQGVGGPIAYTGTQPAYSASPTPVQTVWPERSDSGEIQTRLEGSVRVVVKGYSTAVVTSVELWHGGTRLYSGAPLDTWATASSTGTRKRLRAVARTATATTSETYDDFAVASLTSAVFSPQVLALAIDLLPAPVNGSVTVSGDRVSGRTVTASSETATVGAVDYPTDTTWQTVVSGVPDGEVATVVVADGTDTLTVDIEGAPVSTPRSADTAAGAAVHVPVFASAVAMAAISSQHAYSASAGASVSEPHAASAYVGATAQAGHALGADLGASVEAAHAGIAHAGASIESALGSGPALKRWNGVQYVPVPLRRWTGTQYQSVNLKRT